MKEDSKLVWDAANLLLSGMIAEKKGDHEAAAAVRILWDEYPAAIQQRAHWVLKNEIANAKKKARAESDTTTPSSTK
jgi:hypothetical protein